MEPSCRLGLLWIVAVINFYRRHRRIRSAGNRGSALSRIGRQQPHDLDAEVRYSSTNLLDLSSDALCRRVIRTRDHYDVRPYRRCDIDELSSKRVVDVVVRILRFADTELSIDDASNVDIAEVHFASVPFVAVEVERRREQKRISAAPHQHPEAPNQSAQPMVQHPANDISVEHEVPLEVRWHAIVLLAHFTSQDGRERIQSRPVRVVASSTRPGMTLDEDSVGATISDVFLRFDAHAAIRTVVRRRAFSNTFGFVR